MEGEALIHLTLDKGPPPALEKIVLFLIPPAARESVAGDLCEMYLAPGQYARNALRAIPFIVASQVRRTANLPVLALQGVLLLSWFGGQAESLSFAIGATALILLLLAVLDVYRGHGRPSVRGAIVTAMVAGAAAELCALVMAHFLRPDWQTMPYFAFFGPFMVPVLCLVRTVVMLWSDRSRPQVTQSQSVAQSLAALTGDYRAFGRRTAWQSRIEAAALVLIALILGGFSGRPPSHMAVTVLIYLFAALYLLLDGEAPALSRGLNFSGVRAIFQRELARQHRLRSLIWWLWFVPLFLQIQVSPGGPAQRPLSILEGIGFALLSGFFIESLNRERRGRVNEEIGSLRRSS